MTLSGNPTNAVDIDPIEVRQSATSMESSRSRSWRDSCASTCAPHHQTAHKSWERNASRLADGHLKRAWMLRSSAGATRSGGFGESFRPHGVSASLLVDAPGAVELLVSSLAALTSDRRVCVVGVLKDNVPRLDDRFIDRAELESGISKSLSGICSVP